MSQPMARGMMGNIGLDQAPIGHRSTTTGALQVHYSGLLISHGALLVLRILLHQ